MFDFEQLEIYPKAKRYNLLVSKYLAGQTALDPSTKNQLRRASLSILLNIAEGTSRFGKADRRHFYVISRGSAFECAAVFDYLSDQKLVDTRTRMEFYQRLEEISRMLFTLIRNLK